MADAPIKKPVIGKFSRALDISQTDMKKMYLSDKTFTTFDILELAGELYTEALTSATTITSTGVKSFTFNIPVSKRLRVYSLYVFGLTGSWATDNVTIHFASKSTTNATAGVLSETATNLLTGADLVRIDGGIILNPGDYIKVIANVSSYTSGTGVVYVNVLGMIWDA